MSIDKRSRKSIVYAQLLSVIALASAFGVQSPASGSVLDPDINCPIPWGSTLESALPDPALVRHPATYIEQAHPTFAPTPGPPVRYLSHGNNWGMTGSDITFPRPISAFHVSVVANADSSGAGIFERYDLIGRNASGVKVFEVTFDTIDGDYVFVAGGKSTLAPLNSPSYIVPNAGSAAHPIPATINVTQSLASGESIVTLEIRWTDNTPTPARSGILIAIEETDCVALNTTPLPALVPIEAPQPPTLVCAPSPGLVGETVVCRIEGGAPDVDILWRSSFDGRSFAGRGVRLDGTGVGTFSFIAPASALGWDITVELVDWLNPVSIGVVGGPIPTSVPAGEGAFPLGFGMLVGLAALSGAILTQWRLSSLP
jgi:hypothetical protein